MLPHVVRFNSRDADAAAAYAQLVRSRAALTRRRNADRRRGTIGPAP